MVHVLRKWMAPTVLALLALGVVLVAGCGGGGGGGTPASNVSPTYSQDYAGPIIGTLMMDSSGTPQQYATWTGTVDTKSHTTLTVTPNGGAPVTTTAIPGSNGFTVNGLGTDTSFAAIVTVSLTGGVLYVNGTWQGQAGSGTVNGIFDPNATEPVRKIHIPSAYVGTMYAAGADVTVSSGGNLTLVVPGPTGNVTFSGSILSDGSWQTTGTVYGSTIPMNGNWAIGTDGVCHVTGTMPSGGSIDFYYPTKSKRK